MLDFGKLPKLRVDGRDVLLQASDDHLRGRLASELFGCPQELRDLAEGKSQPLHATDEAYLPQSRVIEYPLTGAGLAGRADESPVRVVAHGPRRESTLVRDVLRLANSEIRIYGVT